MMHCSRQYRTAGLQCNFFGPSKHTTCPSCPHIPSIPTINLHSLGSPRRPPASALYPVLESKTRSCFAASALFTLPDHLGDPCSALVLGSERALSGSIEYRRRARASQRARSSHFRITSATPAARSCLAASALFPVLECRRRARASQRARSARSRITSVTHGSALFPVIASIEDVLVLRRPQSLQCNCPSGASTAADIPSALSEGRIFNKNLKPKQLQIHAFPRKTSDNARTIKFLETAAHGQPRTTVYGENRQNTSPRTTTDNGI